MSKLVAVETCELAFQNPLASANISSNFTLSEKSKSDNKKICLEKIQVTISNYTNGVLTQGTGSGTIQATSVTTTGEGKHLVLENDMSDPITITGMIGDKQSTVQDIVYVKTAGQNVLKVT